MKMHRALSFLLAAAMLLPMVLSGCSIPGLNPTEPQATEPNPTDPAPTDPIVEEVYHGMTAEQLDAIPCIGYKDFHKAMDTGWNFSWDTVVTPETVASKVDFTGIADDQKLWHLGTDGEEGTCATGNCGFGVELRTTGKGNISYMYNKLRIPPGITEFRVWAVGNTDNSSSGEGAVRTVAVYKDENGQYVKKTLTPLKSSFGFMSTTKFYEEDGTIRFSKASWNMPGVQDGLIYYNVNDLPKEQDVIIFIEGIGLGNKVGDEFTEAAEGTPVGQTMSDLVVIKRVMAMATSIPVEDGAEIDVPTDDSEQELLFKIVGNEGLYINFLPPTTKKYEKAPLLFLICGGGWQGQNRGSILSMQAALVADLRAEGFAVVASDYRVISNTNNLTTDQQVGDLFDAMSYVVHHAEVLGIDPQRIATSGHSAGAHLALMVAHAPKDQFPTDGFTEDFKVFASAPLAPVTVIHGTNWSYIATKNGVYDRELAEKLSPINHVRADNAPTLIIHGTVDDVVPFELNAQGIMDKAAEVGAPYEILVSEWGNHVLVCPIRGHVATPGLTEAMHMAADWILVQLDKLNAK